MSAFLGITREPLFSPGKVDADRAILLAVAEVLERRGHAVRVAAGEGALPEPEPGEAVFAMCQGDAALAALREWERRGVRVVNSVASILGCHRHRLLESLRRAAVKAPEALVFDTARVPERWPAWLESAGGWLKRGDVHATEADDVVFVRDANEARGTVARFQARDIARAALQRHVDGTIVKFYAAGDRLIAWFPPSDVELAPSADQIEALSGVARSAAAAVGLDVYGGDCVLDASGGVALIDLNDWPSYAACRAAAAKAIAAHLEKRCDPTHHP
jgi:hypothetical protein